MSRLTMLKPADGVQGVKDFVMETVKQAGANPCPPIVLGIGIGGSFDKCAALAKRHCCARWTSPTRTPIMPRWKRAVGCHQCNRLWPAGLWRCNHLPGRLH